jgi:hypothetical protein
MSVTVVKFRHVRCLFGIPDAPMLSCLELAAWYPHTCKLSLEQVGSVCWWSGEGETDSQSIRVSVNPSLTTVLKLPVSFSVCHLGVVTTRKVLIISPTRYIYATQPLSSYVSLTLPEECSIHHLCDEQIVPSFQRNIFSYRREGAAFV